MIVESVRQEHPKARHHCFAYRLGVDGQQFRSNDDGEPSGTAGKPILGQIDSLSLTNTLIVVVRYFGGKLLGASGLITAYKTSARDALDRSTVITHEVRAHYCVKFDYRIMVLLMEGLNTPDIDILSKQLDVHPQIQISVPVDRQHEIIDRFIASSLRLHLEQVDGQRKFDALQVELMPSDGL